MSSSAPTDAVPTPMSRKKQPIGVQTFREIRREGRYYVDKTGFAYPLIDEGKYDFLSRPRRFGKRLLIDTLAGLFEGKKPLFRRLAAHDRWDWSRRYPGAGRHERPLAFLPAMLRVKIALALLVAGAMTACTPAGLEARRDESRRLAERSGWERLAIDAGHFVLIAHRPPAQQGAQTLSVYIEGDGLAWLGRSEPSLDPTPLDPLALRMALGHPSGAAVHLARPCQFTMQAEGRNCSARYWTTHRFSAEVVASMNRAIDRLKADHGARALELVGYSGGGAIAALVGARRDDVARLITVAGNLDHAAWTRLHRLTPLVGSLNPAEWAPVLANRWQIHLSGAEDREVPPELAEAWVRRTGSTATTSLRVVPGFDHHCCWAESWPALYPRPVPREPSAP